METNDFERKSRYSSIPMDCRHKPIYSIENYGKTDGHHKTNSDVVGISLGKSSWNESEPSVKVWRVVSNKNKQKFSRQSEETTLTRAIDLATLAALVYDIEVNGKKDRVIDSSVYGTIEATVADEGRRKWLHSYLNMEENRLDIIEHIKILKKLIENIKL